MATELLIVNPDPGRIPPDEIAVGLPATIIWFLRNPAFLRRPLGQPREALWCEKGDRVFCDGRPWSDHCPVHDCVRDDPPGSFVTKVRNGSALMITVNLHRWVRSHRAEFRATPATVIEARDVKVGPRGGLKESSIIRVRDEVSGRERVAIYSIDPFSHGWDIPIMTQYAERQRVPCVRTWVLLGERRTAPLP